MAATLCEFDRDTSAECAATAQWRTQSLGQYGRCDRHLRRTGDGDPSQWVATALARRLQLSVSVMFGRALWERARYRLGPLAVVVWLTCTVTPDVLALEPPTVRAIEGHVLAVDEGGIVVDVSSAQGARNDDIVELWRPITLRHPVTRKQVRDRFLIGRLKLTQVRERMTLAEAAGVLDRKPQVGDVVVLRREVEPTPPDATPTPEPPPVEGARPAPPVIHTDVAPPSSAPNDDEANEVTDMFQALRGASLAKRVAAYEDFVRRRPLSRFTPTLYEEALMLRRVGQAQRHDPDAPDRVRFEPPERAVAGEPLTIAAQVDDARGAVVLHFRRRSALNFRTVEMKGDGRGFFSATLTGEQVHQDGLEYFIEMDDEDGVLAIAGNEWTPQQLEVFSVEEPATDEPLRATVEVWSDYADYNRMRGNDYAWQTEGVFSMRFGDLWVRALRNGFGIYRGVGGSLEELDEQGKAGRRIGFTYGYLEMELGFHELVGLALRGVVGLHDHGVTGGGQAFIRIGNDLRTNLLLGGEVLGGVGMRGIAQLELRVFEDWPMLFRTEVTNQPAGVLSHESTVRPKDSAPPEATSLDTNALGGRGIVQLGYRVVDELVISVRGSYQGRTINHSGPGVGGGVSYSW
jgi:hypothetical protein